MNKKTRRRLAVAGASGYVGAELLRYLVGHPQAEVAACLGHSQQGQRLGDLFPHLARHYPHRLESRDWTELGREVDLVFLALPHGQSQEPAQRLLEAGCRVIDLGADFRLRDAEQYARAYGAPHRCPELLAEAVYGLPERYREAIRSARLVANPGCYPTASALALLPLVEAGLLLEPAIIDAKSGVSGAGRSPAVGSLYVEVNESLRAYGVGGHRHQSEIEQTVGQPVIFTPHLTPMTRGIFATVYVRSREADLATLYREFYAAEPFVEVLEEALPSTRATAASNFAQLAVRESGYPGCAIVLVAIDNLGKGAAGTAVHNMNLMFDWPEDLGLSAPAVGL